MGYVNIVCHICEGPLKFGVRVQTSRDHGSTREAGRFDWLKDVVGITESGGPSALSCLPGAPQLTVVRKVTYKPEHRRA